MPPFFQNRSESYTAHQGESLTFPPHLHAGAELLCLLSGECRVRIGGCERRLRAGDCAVAFPNVIHGYERDGAGEEHILLFFSAAMSGEFSAALLETHPRDPFVPRARLHPDVSYALHRLVELHGSGREGMPAARALVQLILARLLPELRLERNEPAPAPELTARLIAYLSGHFCEPLSLDILAAELGASPYRISRIFNSQLHVGFCEYLNACRVGMAKELLRSTREDVLTVALRCGYENPRSFGRAFRRICGCSPREYRQSCGAPKDGAESGMQAQPPSVEEGV